LIYIILLWGCSLHYNVKGMLFQEDNRLQIANSVGVEYFLHAGDDAFYLNQLTGCGAKANGLRIGKHIWVDEWHITDAGDGSEPFLGTILRHGMKFILQDINTGHQIEILTDEDLSSYEGRTILVTGIIVGPHQIRLMTFLPLN
jgi:hypothetical protein